MIELQPRGRFLVDLRDQHLRGRAAQDAAIARGWTPAIQPIAQQQRRFAAAFARLDEQYRLKQALHRRMVALSSRPTASRRVWRRSHRPPSRGDPDVHTAPPAPWLTPGGRAFADLSSETETRNGLKKPLSTADDKSPAQIFNPIFGNGDSRPQHGNLGRQVARLIELASARGMAELLDELGRKRLLGQVIENMVDDYVRRLEAVGREVLAALSADRLPHPPIHPVHDEEGDES
jgi:hypothetical protein